MKKTALITGASSGIGLELAKIFAAKGCNLVLVARNEKKLQQLADTFEFQYDTQTTIIAKDLGMPNAAQEVHDVCVQQNITVDYLINNAGFGDYRFFHEANWAKLQQMISVNITALTHLTHLFLPAMVQRKSGRIMNVSSTAAFQPGPTMSVYFATKAYVLHFSEAISNELEGTGVTVTAYCPGATESGFQAAAAMEESRLVKGKKLPTSKEVAEFGYKAMMKGKRVAIHGFLNAFLASGAGISPRGLVLKMSRFLQEKST